MPCYKSGQLALGVVQRIGHVVDMIVAVDDCCPLQTGDLLERECSDPRLVVVRNAENQGVGGAVLRGYEEAARRGAEILVKIDSDGQMDPALIEDFVEPIRRGVADYTKGNRFFNTDDVARMPIARLIGNAGLSFLSKISSGYWSVFDPTNGYTAIHAKLLQILPFEKIEKRFFFESDLLMRLNLCRAVVVDVPMVAVYEEENSNLSVYDSLFTFGLKHARNFLKRIFYTYFLRDFSVASLQLILGLVLIVVSAVLGGSAWLESRETGIPSSPGTVMLFGISVLVGVNMLLAFLAFDYQMIPRTPVHLTLRAYRATTQGAGENQQVR